ncbi:signal peptide peptidase-domain-containing protein [Suillus subaureus]|uniref:Signal peptide peptidase-domain-containing protein n=1 Tax=Suillus subaureus TaxID=48587 RepID=A0A9P7JDG4_9AGAM|nr:signal peptide peptidase-domain-containing protein [Suillus subaureus]KAG1816134.1 signal peptide peptidase-domain-containing protein [Suillus subaureus]
MASTDWDLISSYAGLLCLASISIYAGAHGSLPKQKSNGTDKSVVQGDEDDEDDEGVADRLSSGDAWLFPVVSRLSSAFGMYAIMKFFGKEWINWFLAWYFSIAGVGSVWKSAASLMRFAVREERWKKFDRNRVLILKGPRELLSVSLRTPTIALFPLALIPSVLFNTSETNRKSALITDILALSFSHNALSLLKIDSFKTGCILLSGLFFYDIYWVFGTDVMLTVATSLDVPIKLLWPKSLSFASERGYTLLGLGDIVIPGTFVALALRYDHARAGGKGTFRKPYFYATLAAYFTGLVTTMTVMHVFGKAQPALLYLSPACMLSLFGVGIVRGELGDAWKWIDDGEVKKSVGDESGKGDENVEQVDGERKNKSKSKKRVQ